MWFLWYASACSYLKEQQSVGQDHNFDVFPFQARDLLNLCSHQIFRPILQCNGQWKHRSIKYFAKAVCVASILLLPDVPGKWIHVVTDQVSLSLNACPGAWSTPCSTPAPTCGNGRYIVLVYRANLAANWQLGGSQHEHMHRKMYMATPALNWYAPAELPACFIICCDTSCKLLNFLEPGFVVHLEQEL